MSALIRLGVIYNGIYISLRIANYLNAAPSSNFSVKEEHILRVLPVAVTGSPNLLCCILRYFTDFAFCCCVI